MTPATKSVPNSGANAPDDAFISMRHVDKFFGNFQALANMSLDIHLGQKIVICGPSGSGKSTAIRCINRLVEPTEGSIELNGLELTRLGREELRKARRRIGMIFQGFNLVDRLTVMENVQCGRLGYIPYWRAALRKYPAEDIERAYHLMERVGIAHYASKRADALSGGERQRVGVVRALMQQGADVNATAQDDGATALMAACMVRKPMQN